MLRLLALSAEPAGTPAGAAILARLSRPQKVRASVPLSVMRGLGVKTAAGKLVTSADAPNELQRFADYMIPALSDINAMPATSDAVTASVRESWQACREERQELILSSRHVSIIVPCPSRRLLKEGRTGLVSLLREM